MNPLQLRGAIKLNGKIPSWLNKLFDYEGQGGSVGIAFSAPGMLGDDEWDLGERTKTG
jgi:hypothetical protein